MAEVSLERRVEGDCPSRRREIVLLMADVVL